MLIKRDVGVAVNSWNSLNNRNKFVEAYEITTSSNHGAFAIVAAVAVAVFVRANQPNLSDCTYCCALGCCSGMNKNRERCKRAAYY